jgi:hypothetical protein
LIARDATELLNKGAPLPLDESLPQVGTISLNVEYFRNVTIDQHGETFTQWITLFDDVDDDEFDGDLGEDDEELPMIKTTFVIRAIEEEKKMPASPPRAQKAMSPKRDSIKQAPPVLQTQPAPVVSAIPTIK